MHKLLSPFNCRHVKIHNNNSLAIKESFNFIYLHTSRVKLKLSLQCVYTSSNQQLYLLYLEEYVGV